MKRLLYGLPLLLTLKSNAQEKAQNLFIITSDGVRWQEVFKGADSLIINDENFVQDTGLTKLLYWDPSPAERRKKLMPFFWNVIAKQGQLYGYRSKESKVNLKNIYKISYPGYNELLTGYADPLPFLYRPQYNRNQTVLQFLSEQPSFKDSVAAFTSWNVFPFILNKKKGGPLQNCGYQSVNDSSEGGRLFNDVQAGILKKCQTRYDLLTFFSAKEYIKQHHPRVVFLSLGETDEAAHRGEYDVYLQRINAVDRMIADLWMTVQADPVYRNNTVFLVATDHGRGRGEKWTTHHTFIGGSGEVWLAMWGAGIQPIGEMRDVRPIVQNQVAATAAFLLGEEFIGNHKIGNPIALPGPETRMVQQDRSPAVALPVTERK